ncbi:MAG: ABC transporter permease, partial [Lachnospiraceae bacterium]|nr:ABC transporter permease [Lachnospiraceae bacterium]
MGALIKFEFIKYLRRKLTVIAMLISLFITGLLFALPGLQFQYVTQNGEIKGADGISTMKEAYKDQNVSITETLVEENVDEIKTLFADEKNVGYDGNDEFLIGDAYWNRVAPKETLLMLLASNYIPVGEYASYEELRNISKESADNFYTVRDEKIEGILNDTNYNMNQNQKDF